MDVAGGKMNIVSKLKFNCKPYYTERFISATKIIPAHIVKTKAYFT